MAIDWVKSYIFRIVVFCDIDNGRIDPNLFIIIIIIIADSNTMTM